MWLWKDKVYQYNNVDEVLGESEITEPCNVNFLGIIVNSHLKWQEHIKLLSAKLASGLYVLRQFVFCSLQWNAVCSSRVMPHIRTLFLVVSVIYFYYTVGQYGKTLYWTSEPHVNLEIFLFKVLNPKRIINFGRKWHQNTEKLEKLKNTFCLY